MSLFGLRRSLSFWSAFAIAQTTSPRGYLRLATLTLVSQAQTEKGRDSTVRDVLLGCGHA